jgi:hypothetical protein
MKEEKDKRHWKNQSKTNKTTCHTKEGKVCLENGTLIKCKF